MKARTTLSASKLGYIDAQEIERQDDLRALHNLVRRHAPRLAPTNDFGHLAYGKFRYKYASGREGDWYRIGIANNKRYISLYCCAADENGYVAERFRARLPKASIGRSCVRFRRLSDLDPVALTELIEQTAAGTFQV